MGVKPVNWFLEQIVSWEGGICYHVLMIPFNFICNMTMLWKSWTLIFWPHSLGSWREGVCMQIIFYHVAEFMIPLIKSHVFDHLSILYLCGNFKVNTTKALTFVFNFILKVLKSCWSTCICTLLKRGDISEFVSFKSVSICRYYFETRYCRVGSHVDFAWIQCTDVRIHCIDIVIECK